MEISERLDLIALLELVYDHAGTHVGTQRLTVSITVTVYFVLLNIKKK